MSEEEKRQISGSPIEGLEGPLPTDGAAPILPLQNQLQRAKNACDFEHNDVRVPDHPYSSVCDCDRCLPQHDNHPSFQFSLSELKYGTYSAKQLRFKLITENEAKNFILPRNYLRRWFVGCTLAYGAFSPDGLLVAACTLSAPAAHSNRFTSKNTKEIRRFVMLDCCGPNSESRFIAWILRETKKLCPHLRYILTFGDPVFDKETPYKAAGFKFDGTSDCSAQWISHKGRRSREAPRPKHRYVYTWIGE